jgi:hypothetical protein
MSKKDLQDVIKTHGYVLTFSSGTLNPEHLLAVAHDIIVEYNLRTPLLKAIRDAYRYKDKLYKKEMLRSLRSAVYYGWAELKEDADAFALWEYVCDYFDDLAPEGYCFGSAEGSADDIGWWLVHDEG